ncbi:hypothetical protein K438DRAFT_2076517 [Mycena galopus ATCC 62051]|nr:hypothetical protein K438DRAFT_2076517 [Mycena galopus ATCC 62051]
MPTYGGGDERSLTWGCSQMQSQPEENEFISRLTVSLRKHNSSNPLTEAQSLITRNTLEKGFVEREGIECVAFDEQRGKRGMIPFGLFCVSPWVRDTSAHRYDEHGVWSKASRNLPITLVRAEYQKRYLDATLCHWGTLSDTDISSSATPCMRRPIGFGLPTGRVKGGKEVSLGDGQHLGAGASVRTFSGTLPFDSGPHRLISVSLYAAASHPNWQFGMLIDPPEGTTGRRELRTST